MIGFRADRTATSTAVLLTAGALVLGAYAASADTVAHAASTPDAANANVTANSGEAVSLLRQEVAAGTLLTHGSCVLTV